jgi:ribonuclease-3
VIAAVYLDAGLERARDVLLPRLDFPEDPDRPRGDPKTELQERIQAKLRRTPVYRVAAEEGPDHSKTFAVEILLGEEAMARGSGRTKKEAEQRAAANLLAVLDAEDLATAEQPRTEAPISASESASSSAGPERSPPEPAPTPREAEPSGEGTA